MVRDALRLTYSHLFMDEFQDTTQVQYDLAKAIFMDSDTVVTAVGDNKQQIMRWAMAMADPFTPYEADFKAQRTPLHNNYRSSPDLVRIQDVLAKALDAKASTPVSKIEGTISGDSCAVWDFSTPSIEADRLADFIAKQMAEHKLAPRDFSILVRQKPGDYMKLLEPAFAKRKSSFATRPCKSDRLPYRNSWPKTCRTTFWLFCGFSPVSGPAVIGPLVLICCVPSRPCIRR